MNSYGRQVSEYESCRLTHGSMGACGFVSTGNFDPLLSETAHDFLGGLAPPFRSFQHGHPSGLMLRLISHFSPSLGYNGNSLDFHGFPWLFYEGVKNHHQIASSQRWFTGNLSICTTFTGGWFQAVMDQPYLLRWYMIEWMINPRVLTILSGLTIINFMTDQPMG